MARAGNAGPLLIALAAVAAFAPVIGYPFLNWDDQRVFALNDGLRAPGVIGWAFTTRYMEHYQPLAWLTWAAVDRTIGLTPAAAHALTVALHALCAALVYALARRATPDWRLAAIAALVWALHPLRVEVVAWASAMPYALALLLALLSTMAWLDGRAWPAVALFGLSLLARPIAVGLPLVVVVVAGAAEAARYDGRVPTRARPWLPIAAAAGLAVMAAMAETSARLTASLTEFGIGPRLTLAATAPWLYLWRTLAPVDLTPLDPLALAPRTEPLLIAIGLAGLIGVTAAAWRWRRDYPVVAGSWAAYLALLVPAMGLVPSGLQATADRYTYLPAVPLSLMAASVLTTMNGATVRAAAAAAVAVLALLTWRQAPHWSSSTALWTRAVRIDPRNDVALYNLGTALAEAGRRDEALARYEQVLAILPAHPGARRNHDLLKAEGLEAEGNQLAANREFEAASGRYAEAVRLDSQRAHARAALGMALIELGRLDEARPHLQTAFEQGSGDPAVPNALAYVLIQAGEREAAVAVLRDAQRRHPDDPNIARNLAMLTQR